MKPRIFKRNGTWRLTYFNRVTKAHIMVIRFTFDEIVKYLNDLYLYKIVRG